MLQKTSGVILKTTKYSENSLIVKIYTQQFGLQSYIINGVRNKKSKNRISVFQPLSIVDLEVINSEKKTLQRITEINLQHSFSDIPFNIIKSSISIFVNEMLYRSIKEEHPDDDLYDFIIYALKILDGTNENCSNFPIVFVLELSKFLGFFPQGEYSNQNNYFDLQEGVFIASEPHHPYYLKAELAVLLDKFLKNDFENYYLIAVGNDNRRKLLDILIEFYKLHIHGFSEIKSHKVLEEIIS